MTLTFLVEKSNNSKTGNIAVTYTTIKGTCSDDCPLKDKLCYAQTGMVGVNLARLDKAFNGESPEEIAKQEIQTLVAARDDQKRRPLRLHVAGDTRTRKAARIISKAAAIWANKNGGVVYTYTHSWRNIPRSLFGKVSVLASVEKPAEIKQAKDQGYAAAIVVEKFESTKAYYMGEHKIVPCPAQTRDSVTCASCKLCFNADKLNKIGVTIAFEAHGARKKRLSLI